MATYTPRQKNWRWVANDSATTPTPLANENAQPTLANNTDIIHLRFTFAEIGGKADTTVAVALQYSLSSDMSSPVAFGAAPAHWNYANGLGTEGDAVSGTSQLSDDTSFGEYCESGTNSLSVGASAALEVDFAIQATASVSGNTTYYFQCVQQGSALELDTAETYPNLVTAAEANSYPYTGLPDGSKASSSGTVASVDFAAVFDDIRQAIIDGIDGDLSTGTSWDSVRSGIAVGSVVRTSDSVVTITLDALATYAITADETLTVTLPWNTMTGGRSASVVATPTVVIANTEAYSYASGGCIAYAAEAVTETVTAGASAYSYAGNGALAFNSESVRARAKVPSLGGAFVLADASVTEKTAAGGTDHSYTGIGVFAFSGDSVRAKAKVPSVGGALAQASGTVASSDLVVLWTQVGTGATAAVAAGAGSQDITLPGTPATGDLVVVAVSGDTSCANSITTAGYTLVENGTGANPGAHSGYKVMGLTPDTVVSIARHTSIIKSAAVQVFRGGDRDSILDVSTAAATGSSANPQSNVIGTGTDNALVVVIAHLDDDDSTVSTWPTGYDTWSVSANTGQSSTAIGSTTAMCARVVASAGTETPSAFTMSSADQWQAIAISFKLASSGTDHAYVGLPAGCMALSAATVSSPPIDAFEYTGTAVYSHAAGTVVSAAPFAHMRRAILNNIVSAQNEATGWNAVKGTIPLTAVARTSDTTVTVTLPALSTYDITAAETLTVNVPPGSTAAGDAIVATPTVAIQTSGAHAYTGSAAMSFRGASAYSGTTILLHVYTGSCTQVKSSGTFTAESTWSEWSEVRTFTTAGIEVGGGMKYSAASTYRKGREAFSYVGQGVIAYANGTERSVGRVYVGSGAYHFQSGTVVANTVSVSYNYTGAGAIVNVAGTLYETDLAEDFPNAESYIGSGSYSFQSAFERVIGRAWESPYAASVWSGGADLAFITSTVPRADVEDKPALRTVSREAVPTRPPAQDGVDTEYPQDGAWGEYPVQGSYAHVGYEKEYKPFRRATQTKEDRPL